MTSSRVSAQLFSVREALNDDVDGTLRRVAEMGYTQVEPFNFMRYDGLADALAAHSLSAPTAHAHVIGESPDAQSTVFAAARALGVRTMIDPHTAAERWQTAAHVAEVAAQVNESARIATDHGLRFGYHNHVHEIQNVINGRTALELFAERIDPEVALEVDTYWVAVGGADPTALLRTLGTRVAAIHIKDGPATSEKKDQVALGNGSMPIREIIDAAPDALRVVEVDDSRFDRFQVLSDSLTFLKSEGLA